MERKKARLRGERARRESERRRREERDRLEEEDVARAIRLVEDMVRRDEEERQAEEARRQEELARLERERLAEEERKAEERAEAERMHRVDLKESFQNRMIEFQGLLRTIIQEQQLALIERHEKEWTQLSHANEQATCQEQETATSMLDRIEANVARRRKDLSEKHDRDHAALADKHEHGEDDFFLQLQIHLRGRANREEREMTMKKEFQKAQQEERNELEHKQKKESDKLERDAEMERKGVQLYAETVGNGQHDRQHKEQHLASIIAIERKWFEVVSSRRRAMLQRHGEIGLAELVAGAEEVIATLTEHEAATILPLPLAGTTTTLQSATVNATTPTGVQVPGIEVAEARTSNEATQTGLETNLTHSLPRIAIPKPTEHRPFQAEPAIKAQSPPETLTRDSIQDTRNGLFGGQHQDLTSTPVKGHLRVPSLLISPQNSAAPSAETTPLPMSGGVKRSNALSQRHRHSADTPLSPISSRSETPSRSSPMSCLDSPSRIMSQQNHIALQAAHLRELLAQASRAIPVELHSNSGNMSPRAYTFRGGVVFQSALVTT